MRFIIPLLKQHPQTSYLGMRPGSSFLERRPFFGGRWLLSGRNGKTSQRCFNNLFGAILLGLLLVSQSETTFAVSASGEAKSQGAAKDSQGLPLQQIRALAQAYRQIKTHYVRKTDDKALFEAAIAGMVASLDAHSEYLDARQYARFRQDNEGDFAGIGVSLSEAEKGLEVVYVVAGSPADKAGIQEKDIITQVNGRRVAGLALDEAVAEIAGEAGSQLSLTLLEQSGRSRSLKLQRAVIHRESVWSKGLAGGVGYLRIDSFNFETSKEFSRALTDLAIDAAADSDTALPQTPPVNRSLPGLIIDLRDNPGGIIDSAIAIADHFIAQGVLVRAVARDQVQTEVWQATANNSDTVTPLILLVNGGTASAAEILAVALQAHGRAKLLGQPTWGKGSIQTIYELDHERAIKLTSAYYLGPFDQAIDGVGLKPDIRQQTQFQLRPNSSIEELMQDPAIKTAYNQLLQVNTGEVK